MLCGVGTDAPFDRALVVAERGIDFSSEMSMLFSVCQPNVGFLDRATDTIDSVCFDGYLFGIGLPSRVVLW